MSLRLFSLLAVLALLPGCSTLKGWFTTEGQKLSLARDHEAHQRPLQASALSLEALALDPEYKEARALLDRTFGAGQDQFRAEEKRFLASEAADRWDQLYDLYSWQNRLAAHAEAAPDYYRVVPVDDLKTEAGNHAAEYHFQRARAMSLDAPGPRQARRAWAEGRVAAGFGRAEGLDDWLDSVKESATQALLVIPFYHDGTATLSGPLSTAISRKLTDQPPELTTIFPSNRVITLPGGGPALVGLISQPDAWKLAEAAGQNLVLMGQIQGVQYQAPRSVVTSEKRERKVTVVDPDHPSGVEKTYKATVTKTKWTVSVAYGVSFNVTEVATKKDLLQAFRDTRASDEVVELTYTGDKEALTDDDLRQWALKERLVDTGVLWSRASDALAVDIAALVRTALN